MDTSHHQYHHLITNSSVRNINNNNQKFKIKNNRSISNMRSYKQSINLNDLTYPSNSSLGAVCHSETFPKQQSSSFLMSNNVMHNNKNLHMFHIRYEFLANKKCSENEMSLKHDILVLIAQLKEKEEIIGEMKTLLNKYEDNKNNNNNYNVQQLLNENKKLKNDIKGLNDMINKYKHMIYNNNNIKKFDSNKFKECRQYSFNYIILNTNVSKIKRKVIQHDNNNMNMNNYVNDVNVVDLQLNKLISFSKRENHKHPNTNTNLIFKPLIENKILQYDRIKNSYTLITPIDYSNFFTNYSKCGSRYITINNILYIVSGISFNILYSFNPISNALLKIATLKHNHKHCGLIAYQNNKIAIIGGENTTSIEVYDITSKKLLTQQNLLDDMNIPELPCSISSNCSFVIVNKDIIVCFGEFNDCCLLYVMRNTKWECLKLKESFPLKSGLLFNNRNGMENVVYLYTIDGKFYQINIESGNVDLIKDNMNGVINKNEVSFDLISMEFMDGGKSFVYFYDSNNNVYKISLANFEIECDYY